MLDNEITEVSRLLNQYHSFLITGTSDADGDSIGAQLALYNIFQKKIGPNHKKIIKVINEKACPSKYSFLPDADKVSSIDGLEKERFDVGFVLDGGSERAGKVKDIFKHCQVKVLVDHHKFGSCQGYDIRLVDPAISSTCEIVYNLMKDKSFLVDLDKSIASQLYLGFIFDTGFFRHPNTTPQTLRAASNLLAAGINFSEIAHKGMVEKNYNAQKLLGRVLGDLEREMNGKVIVATVTKSLMQEVGAKEEDQEGLINELNKVKGVEVCVLIKEHKKNSYKISFRSKSVVDVARLSRDLDPLGGGHERAAGCLLNGGYREIKNNIISRLKEILG